MWSFAVAVPNTTRGLQWPPFMPTCAPGRAAEMMRFNEFLQVVAAHEFARVAEGVVEIEIVDAKLVGNNRAFVVRHAAGDPMVSTDGFDVPDFVHIRNDDAVRFVRPVCFEQFSEALHTFARGVDVRQHEGDDVFFADAAWGFRLTIGFVGRLQCDQRVGAEHALVDGDGFGGAHGHVAFVDAQLPQGFHDLEARSVRCCTGMDCREDRFRRG